MILDERHYKAIQMMVDGKVTNNEIAEELGLHRNTISKWRHDPTFQAEFKRYVITNTQGDLPDLLKAIQKHAVNGNAAMAKLILTANDMLTERVSVEDNSASNTIDLNKIDSSLEVFQNALEDDAEE